MKAISNIANHIFRHTPPTFRTQDNNGGNGLIRENQSQPKALERTCPSAPKSASSRTVPSAEPSPHAISIAQKTTSRAFCAIDCPGRCPLVLELRDGELARVRANKAAPACHRGLSMRAWANSPDRLMWPMRRVGPRGSAQFERITWDEALDTVARELARVRREFGNDAIYLAYSTGQSCTTADPFERLLNCFGGFLDRYNNYSNPQINAMVRALYGEGALYPGGSDLDAATDANLLLVFGASPAETGTGRATWHGAWDRVCKQLAARGGRIVMVDPRRNGSIREAERAFDREAAENSLAATRQSAETPTSTNDALRSSSRKTSPLDQSCPSDDQSESSVAEHNREAAPNANVTWLPVNPGTDGALVAALLHELTFTHNALAWDFLRECCIGFTDDALPARWRGKGLSVLDYLRGTGYDRVAKTPAWAARITGASETAIRDLARELAHARPAFIMQGWGPQRRSNGEMTSGMIMLLALALGQVGLPGTNNGMNVAWGGGFLTHVSAGHNSVPFRIPAYRFLDAIEDGTRLGAAEGVRGLAADQRLAHGIKAIVCHGGNCLTNQHGDVNRAHRVLADTSACEFIVNIDVEFTDSARYADIVLPDLFRMEQVSVMDADTWGRRIVAADGTLGPHFERRGAWDMCCDLAKRWGIEATFAEGITEAEWICKLYEADRERTAQVSRQLAPEKKRVATEGTQADSEQTDSAQTLGAQPACQAQETRDDHAAENAPVSTLPPFEQLLEQGVCFREDAADAPFVALADWRRDPVAHPLDTPSGKAEIFSEHLAAVAESLHGTPDEGAITPIPTYVPEWSAAEFGVDEPEDGNEEGDQPASESKSAAKALKPNAGQNARNFANPASTAVPRACDQALRVFGFHSVARIHSSWGNVFAMPKRPPQVISINPTDAAARGIRTGDLVKATNRFGALRLPAEVTDDVIAGTVIMPQGAWWKADSSTSPHPVDVGGCINTLTSSRPSPLAFGNPQHTCWCRITRITPHQCTSKTMPNPAIASLNVTNLFEIGT